MPNAKHSSASDAHLTPEDIVEASRTTLGQFDLDPASTPFANELVRAERIYTRADDGLIQPWQGQIFLNPPGGALEQEICGTRSRQALWWGRLANAWKHEEIQAAMFIGFSLELLQTAQSIDPPVLQPLDFPHCVPKARIKFDVLADELIDRLHAERRNRDMDGKLTKAWERWFQKRVTELDPLRGRRISGDQPTHANVVVFLPPSRRPDNQELVVFRSAFQDIGYVNLGRLY